MKKNILILSLLAGFLFLPAVGHADSSQEVLERANDAYYKNQLKLAEQLYQQLLGEGIANGHLFYNIANVFYRQAEVGEALQYYEKAVRYLPRNADVRANLKFVEQKRLDRLEEPPWMVFLKIFFFWYTFFTIKELIIAFTVLSGALWMLAWLHLILRRGYLKWGAVVLFVLCVLLGSSIWFKYDFEKVREWAIVLKTEVDVRPTYLEQEKSLFKLHEGTKVQIIGYQEFGENDSWAQIRLPKGQKGWIRLENLGLI